MYYVNLKSPAYDIDEKLVVDANSVEELEEKLLTHLGINKGGLLMMDSLSNVPHDAEISNYDGYPRHYYLTIEKVKLV